MTEKPIHQGHVNNTDDFCECYSIANCVQEEATLSNVYKMSCDSFDWVHLNMIIAVYSLSVYLTQRSGSLIS